jgi:AraC-like DNA-binding protein
VKYIFDHACENITLSTAAHGLGISESHLSHLFSQQFRINFRRFVNAIRIDKAEALMRDPTMTLTAICYACGYENMRTFRRAFVRETGLLPTAYLQKMRGENALVTSFEA